MMNLSVFVGFLAAFALSCAGPDAATETAGALLSCPSGSSLVSIQRGTLGAVEDACPRSDQPDAAKANGTTVGVLSTRHAVFEWSLTPIPSTKFVTSAAIGFYVYTRTGSPVINVHANSAAWSEATVTWNNEPAFGATIATLPGTASGDIAVTLPASVVQGWLTGPYGVTLECGACGGSGSEIIAASEDATTARHPRLDVCVTDCLSGSDCPGADTECRTRTCVAGTCGATLAPSGTALSGQTAGDCAVAVCDGAGGITSAVDATDVPADDGNPCTSEACISGAPAHPNTAAGASCPGGACDGAGACVAPPVDAGSDAGSPTCSDGARNGAETGVDCGGPSCAPCGVGMGCVSPSDCATGLCALGTCRPLGVAGPVISSCTVPLLPSPAAPESIVVYDASDPVHGWGVVTAPPPGVEIIGAFEDDHGGAWNDRCNGVGVFGDPGPNSTSIRDTAQALAGLGYVVYSPCYPGSNTAGMVHPAHVNGVLCAGRWLRDYMAGNACAAGLCVDGSTCAVDTDCTGHAAPFAVRDRIFVGGTSAGAHLSLLAMLSEDNAPSFPGSTCPRSGDVGYRGALGWGGGAYDLRNTTYIASISTLIDGMLGYARAGNLAGALAASPIGYLDPLDGPIFLATCSGDPVLPASESTAMQAAALASGVDSTLAISSCASHGDALFDPTAPIQACSALAYLESIP